MSTSAVLAAENTLYENTSMRCFARLSLS